jgi:hypothetical protein
VDLQYTNPSGAAVSVLSTGINHSTFFSSRN